MGNCCALFKINKSKNNKNITVILTGLDNSGKTTMAKKLIGEPVDNVLKTVGFSLIKLHHHDYNVNLYDLGGSPQIRQIWSKYYMDAHGIIYMVDASDISRLHESKLVFAELLSHENISGKHVLILANKQDKENALDELDIVEQLDVEYIVNQYRCPTRIEICSVLGQNSVKIDSSIVNGYKWLIDNIIENYNAINERVLADMSNYALLVQKDREEWKKRVESNENENVEEDVVSIKNGNPFKPIDTLIKNGTGDSKKILNDIDNNSKPRGIIHPAIKVEKTSVKNVLNKHVTFFKETVKDQKQKLNQKYHRHKRKFIRFNKTSPILIDTLTNSESRFNIHINHAVPNSSSENPTPSTHNYLQSRPKTAPSSLHSIKCKTAAWDLAAPLEGSFSTTNVFTISKDGSDSEDVISFF